MFQKIYVQAALLLHIWGVPD